MIEPADCGCECDRDDLICWEQCHDCLDNYFSGDEGEGDMGDDEGEGDMGDDGNEAWECETECNCADDDFTCWDACGECMDGEEAGDNGDYGDYGDYGDDGGNWDDWDDWEDWF